MKTNILSLFLILISINFSWAQNCVPSPYDASDLVYQAVIQGSPSCCTDEWEMLCQFNYDLLSIINDNCAPSPYSVADETYNYIVFNIPACCEEWTSDCQQMYDFVSDGGNASNCVPSPYDENDATYLYVIANNPACCDTEWSAACQQAYDDIYFNPGDCVPSPYDESDAYYQTIISVFPECCNTEWSTECQQAYDDLVSGGSDCANSPYDESDEYYLAIIQEYPECCDVEWTETCQANYDNLIGVGIENVNWIKTVKLYPNPVQNELNISFGGLNSHGVAINVFNIQGVSVLEKTVLAGAQNGDVDLSNLNSGVYLLQLQHDSIIIARRIIVKH